MKPILLLAGALAFFDQAEAKIAKSVLKGWAEDHERLPMWPIRCSPYSVVDESARAGAPKFRLTNDLSWPKPGVLLEPHGLATPSLNDAMDRSAWPPAVLLRLAQVASGMMVLKASGAPVTAFLGHGRESDQGACWCVVLEVTPAHIHTHRML